MSLTLTRLLACAQAVSCSTHAGSSGRGGGETQLGAVSIVMTAEIGSWEHTIKGAHTHKVIKEQLQRDKQEYKIHAASKSGRPLVEDISVSLPLLFYLFSKSFVKTYFTVKNVRGLSIG